MKIKTVVKNILPDSIFLRLCYRRRMGKKLNLKTPQTFNEKMQWLKIYDRNPAYTALVDKCEVKKLLADQIGEEYIIPTLGVWDSFDDIDFNVLPNQFVLKCTHDSGGLVIVRDKAKLDKIAAKEIIEKSLNRNYYYAGREWPYKNVPPRIICEAYIEDKSGQLADYKVHCFNGEPKMILVCRDRFEESGLTQDFFTENWVHMPVKRPKHPNASVEIAPPKKLDEMLHLASILAKNLPFARIDFYEVNGKVYFGEITFYPASGMEKFVPSEWDDILGSWLKLPNKSHC